MARVYGSVFKMIFSLLFGKILPIQSCATLDLLYPHFMTRKEKYTSRRLADITSRENSHEDPSEITLKLFYQKQMFLDIPITVRVVP